MKKLLALLLAGLMFIGFCVGASAQEGVAQAPEDDLQVVTEQKTKLQDFSDFYWDNFWWAITSPFTQSIFSTYFGAPAYPMALIFALGFLIISPAMLILRLFL